MNALDPSPPAKRFPRGIAAMAAFGLILASAVMPGFAPNAAAAVGHGDIGSDVIPAVSAWTSSDGTATLDADWRIVVSAGQTDLKALAHRDVAFPSVNTVASSAQVLARDLADVTGLTLPVGTGVAGAKDIELVLVDDTGKAAAEQTGPEGYTVSVHPDRIRIEAATTKGLYYGGRTVLQALRGDAARRTLATGKVFDVPGQAVRPYTLDVSREFWTPREVEDVIRQMGWMKQNTLILHLDDAEYFRLNSPKYPGLADPAFSYNREDVRAFVSLGHENGVTVVPAFEFPGHLSHRAAYFHIGMADGPIEVAPGFGDRDTGATPANTCGQQYTHSHLTPDFTMNFMHPKAMANARETLDEFVPWFDSPWVHVGGDEVPPALANCPALKTWMANQSDPQLKTLSGIEQWIINQLRDHLASMERRIIVYNGFESGIPLGASATVKSDVIIQLWTGSDSSPVLQPYDRIMGNGQGYYLVPARNWGPETAGIFADWYGGSAADSRKLGVGMHIWGDDLGWAQGQFLETMAYPARAVTAERSWNPSARGDYKDFMDRLLPQVGTAPFYLGAVTAPATNDGRPIHSWIPSDPSFPAGTFDAHSGDNRRGLVEVCGLNGMTPLFSGLRVTEDPVFGRVQGGNFWNLGAPDLSGDWTFSATMKATSVGSALLSVFDTSYNAIRADGSVGTPSNRGLKMSWGGEMELVSPTGVVTFKYSPPLNSWVTLTFVSQEGRTTLYADGAKVAHVDQSTPLPLQRLGGRGVSFAGAQVYSQALTAEQVAEYFKSGPPKASCVAAAGRVETPVPAFGALPPTVGTPAAAEGPTRGGTEVTITGRSLSAVTEVLFGTVPASSFRIVDDNTIVVVSPALPKGTVPITFSHDGGTVEAGTFRAVPSAVAPLTITPFSSTVGPKPTITGTGHAGALVTLRVDGEPIGTTTVGDDGNWSFNVTSPLTSGEHEASATQTDAEGGVSDPVTARFVVAATDPGTSPSPTASDPAVTPPGGDLAVTGGAIPWILLSLGVLALALGVAFVRLSRTRRH